MARLVGIIADMSIEFAVMCLSMPRLKASSPLIGARIVQQYATHTDGAPDQQMAS
jgi:hypothetical protein